MLVVVEVTVVKAELVVVGIVAVAVIAVVAVIVAVAVALVHIIIDKQPITYKHKPRDAITVELLIRLPAF